MTVLSVSSAFLYLLARSWRVFATLPHLRTKLAEASIKPKIKPSSAIFASLVTRGPVSRLAKAMASESQNDFDFVA